MKHLYSPKTYILSIFILTLCFSINAQVGIGTTDPKTHLDVDGALSLREGATLTLADGLNADVDLGTTPNSFYRISGPAAAFSINSIVPETDADGQIVTFINTTTQSLTIIHGNGTADNRIVCPNGDNIVLTNRWSTFSLQYNSTYNKWFIVGLVDNSNSIDSVTLGTNIEISSSSWANVPSISTLTFTAKKSSVLVMLSASGHGYTNSMSLVQFRVQNTTSGTTIGGTHTKIQSYDSQFLGSTYSVTTWSASFSKLLTGLTVGNTYTLQVQGQVQGVLGTYNAVINPATLPNSEHLTLNVIQ